MNEKLQQLIDKLAAERDEFRLKMHLGGMETREEWDKAETRWENLQLRLRDAGLALADKAGDLIEEVEDELRELKEEATEKAWKLNFKSHDEIHDMGEGVDRLQHKISDTV